MDRKKVILDVDAGVDDAMAIILALRSPQLEVAAITTVTGNVHVDHCTKNVLRILALLDMESPPVVARGEDRPLVKEPVYADFVHGFDGLGDLGDDYYPPLDWGLVSSQPATELMPRLIEQHPGEVTIIGVGPLTNIARAIQSEPVAMSKAKGIVVMAGAIHEMGVMPPLRIADFNTYVDPEALEIVLGFTVPVTLVAVDATYQACVSRKQMEELGMAENAVPRFIAESSRMYMDIGKEEEGFDGA